MSPEPTSPAQQIRVYETEGRTVVQLRGAIDLAVVLPATARLDAATARPNLDVVVDLGPVTFLDCSGLGLLCRTRRRVEERGGHLTLVCPHPTIRRLIHIVGLDRAFTLTTTPAEAPD
ncbi:anti-anti-sigma regulatory factor, SpoIIAA [Actinobacteria bacterium OK074]|nr:anti-anti-sigma regulatory factor, SpoIIAA [Actinobacteria bacterium OK074]